MINRNNSFCSLYYIWYNEQKLTGHIFINELKDSWFPVKLDYPVSLHYSNAELSTNTRYIIRFISQLFQITCSGE